MIFFLFFQLSSIVIDNFIVYSDSDSDFDCFLGENQGHKRGCSELFGVYTSSRSPNRERGIVGCCGQGCGIIW